MALEAENQNTHKSDEKCEKIFTKYLQQSGESDTNYWDWPLEKINGILSKFWFAACNVESNYYRVSTLKHIWYGLNRCFQRHGHGYDIITSNSYKDRQKSFKDACTNLKKLGYGYTQNYPEILPQGNNLIDSIKSDSSLFTSDAQLLLAKIHVACLLTFCKSQSENR